MGESTPVIINEVLYYVQNRINNSPDEIITTACINFYTPEEIDSAKRELFQLLENINFEGKRLPGRVAKRDPKKAMEDILSTFKACDAAKETLPIFVSQNLHRVPNDDEGNQSIKCVMAALGDLQHQIKKMSDNFVSKSDLAVALQCKSVGESQPPDRSALPSFFENLLNSPTPRRSRPLSTATTNRNLLMNSSASATAAASSAPKESASTSTSSGPTSTDLSAPTVLSAAPTAAAVAAASAMAAAPTVATIKDGGHRRSAVNSASGKRNGSQPPANRKKRADVVIGKSVSSGAVSFKGADLTIHRFIGNVHPDVDVETMKTDLTSMGISVIELQQNVSKFSRFKSFHLMAKRSDAEKIDNPDTWPENIIIRRFFLPRRKPSDESEQGNQ